MIEKLDSKMDCVEITVLGKHTECLGFDSAKEIGKKLNELVDAVNGILDYAPLEMAQKAEPEPSKNVRPPYMQNKRLRKALGIAQSALVKLANDAYDMDEHIYIDKILNQIERITKGGDNE